MDIVVTIPKHEYQNDEQETLLFKTGGYEQFWTLRGTPKNLSVGERVYFIKKNSIESSMRIHRIEKNTETNCIVTNRNWKGICQLFLSDLREESINLQVKGFQGFRYKWW